MIINIDNLNDLELTGVYKIQNLITGKYYIGSTKQCFRVRYNHHLQALKNNKHKNLHLQHAYNKYGDENFEFVILKICDKDDTYVYEQQYIDNSNKSELYNINLLATGPCEDEESKQKRIKSFKKYLSGFKFYYEKYKAGELDLEQIPLKFHKKIVALINYHPWNKNKKYASTEHLCVPHKKSDRTNCKNTMRDKSPVVYVYDSNWNFLDSFRSSKDLEELSLSLSFPLNSRFSKPRSTRDVKQLLSGNINKAIKNKITYKGLYFTNLPVHQGIDDAYEPKSVKVWNDNTEVTKEGNMSLAPYSIETETVVTE